MATTNHAPQVKAMAPGTKFYTLYEGQTEDDINPSHYVERTENGYRFFADGAQIGPDFTEANIELVFDDTQWNDGPNTKIIIKED